MINTIQELVDMQSQNGISNTYEYYRQYKQYLDRKENELLSMLRGQAKQYNDANINFYDKSSILVLVNSIIAPSKLELLTISTLTELCVSKTEQILHTLLEFLKILEKQRKLELFLEKSIISDKTNIFEQHEMLTKPKFFFNRAGHVDSREPRIQFSVEELSMLFYGTLMVFENLKNSEILRIYNTYNELFDMKATFVYKSNFAISAYSAIHLPTAKLELWHQFVSEFHYNRKENGRNTSIVAYIPEDFFPPEEV